MLTFGFMLVGIGGVLNAIGGFIAMARNPSAFNNHSRAYFDPVRKGIPDDAIEAGGKAQWNDPKAKWFTRIGMILALGGVVLVYIGSHWSSADNQPSKIGITRQLATSPREAK